MQDYSLYPVNRQDAQTAFHQSCY